MNAKHNGNHSKAVTAWATLALLLVLCACSAKDEAELLRIGFPYGKNVWVDYMFDKAHPGNAVIIVNPYSDRIVGQHAGGIRNGVIYSNWTTEKNGTLYGWQVDLRADPPVIQVAGRTGTLNNGRFIILTDSKAQDFPKQIDIPIPVGLKSDSEVRKWLDGIREAGITGLSATGVSGMSSFPNAEETKAQIANLRKRIIPPKGTSKAEVEAVFDRPKEAVESNKKGPPIIHPTYRYELLQPRRGQEFRAYLYISYKQGRVDSAGINHSCVTKGRFQEADPSEIDRENKSVLIDLIDIESAYRTKLNDASWNESQGLSITQKESKLETSLGEMAATEYYRGDSLILKRVVPPDESHYTVYYVIHNGFEILTYKSGTAGTEFAEAGIIRDQVKPDYTIKMAGDKEGRIQRITLYSPDFSKTYESFWLRNKELIPWTAEELTGWRKLRDNS